MAQGFRLELAVPATNISSAFSKVFTETDNAVQQIEVTLKKEKGRSSYLTASIHDPMSKIIDTLPDVAFFDVPVTLYMAKASRPQSITTKVFSGIVTAYDVSNAGTPQSMLQVVAHDNSFKARINAVYNTIKNKTSVQAATALAARYGLTLDALSVGDVKLVQRIVDIGIPATGEVFMSDWDQLNRMLYSDGLTCFVHDKKLVIHQAANAVYPATFRPGDGVFIDLNFRINHIRGPGGMGNTTTPVAFDYQGVDKAVQGSVAVEAAKVQGGSGKTHRRPVGGASIATTGSHVEDTAGAKWENHVTRLRARKDEATLTLNPTPDLFLTHIVNLDAVSAKANGAWESEEIKHVVVPGDAGSHTVASLHRGPNKQAAKQVGSVAFAFGGT